MPREQVGVVQAPCPRGEPSSSSFKFGPETASRREHGAGCLPENDPAAEICLDLGSPGPCERGFFRAEGQNTFLKIILFIYFLAVLGLCCCAGLSLAATSEGSSLWVVLGLLTAEQGM